SRSDGDAYLDVAKRKWLRHGCKSPGGRGHTGGRWYPLTPVNEFLQSVTISGDKAAVAPGGQDHFAHVDVAVGIEGQVVGREEVADGPRLALAAPAGQEFAPAVEHTQPGTHGVSPSRPRRALPGKQPRAPAHFHHEDVVAPVDADLHRPDDVGPLGQELALWS